MWRRRRAPGPTSYTATLEVSWVAVCMLFTEWERSADFSSTALLDSLRSSKVIFCVKPDKRPVEVKIFSPLTCTHERTLRQTRGPLFDWVTPLLLTFLLSCGLMKVRSSRVRRMRLGPLTSWICWSLLLPMDSEKMKKRRSLRAAQNIGHEEDTRVGLRWDVLRGGGPQERR